MEVNVLLDKLQAIVDSYVIDYAQKYNNELEKKYLSLIDNYYEEYTPSKYTKRKYRLKGSYETYIDVGKGYIGFGIRITGEYIGKFWSAWTRGRYISGARYVERFITEDITFHGGDWHGGYGQKGNTSIYNAMTKYADELVNKI